VVKVGVWQNAQPHRREERVAFRDRRRAAWRVGRRRRRREQPHEEREARDGAQRADRRRRVGIGDAVGDRLELARRALVALDLFCAFQPKRAIVPSLPLLLRTPTRRGTGTTRSTKDSARRAAASGRIHYAKLTRVGERQRVRPGASGLKADSAAAGAVDDGRFSPIL
jgi:hypothetical protein